MHIHISDKLLWQQNMKIWTQFKRNNSVSISAQNNFSEQCKIKTAFLLKTVYYKVQHNAKYKIKHNLSLHHPQDSLYHLALQGTCSAFDKRRLELNIFLSAVPHLICPYTEAYLLCKPTNSCLTMDLQSQLSSGSILRY